MPDPIALKKKRAGLPVQHPPRIVYIGILLSALSLAAGFLTGIAALAVNNGYPSIIPLANGITFHPDLMVFGAVGGLLISEKLELMEKFPLIRKIPISRPIVAFLFGGVFILSLGILSSYAVARYAGLLLVVAASLLFLLFMSSNVNHGDKRIKLVFAAAIASMSLAAIGNMNSLLYSDVKLTFLALLFPILYILAERMELGFVRGMGARIMALQAYIAWFAVGMAFVSVEVPDKFISRFAMVLSIILVAILTGISIKFDPAFRKIKRNGRFQHFMRAGIQISFFWLLLGLILFMLQAIIGHGYLDPATHSIAIGFIGSFIVAHSPVIFPLTFKKKAIQENVTFLPLIMITIANVSRVFGDLAIPYTSLGETFSYVSGYLLLFAILLFVYNIKKIMVSPD
ncbi:NnrS family protein [Ferroplasma acidiphilum]|uniref:NnrS family protein n=1 Tax=Ferroplasma acidiphilum TaxID=74969 RepID=UPI0023F15D0E|nr:NnrS family protein [Ferroplasma acidiphilum]